MQSKKRLPRSSFVVTLSAAAVLGACGGTTAGGGNPPPLDVDAGNDGGNPAGCPSTAPTATSCALPDGTTCSYGGGCYPSEYTCEHGQWARMISNPPAPVCPQVEPTAGSSCNSCEIPSSLHCSYVVGTCQGQPVRGELACVSSKWQLLTGTGSCNPPAPDAGPPPPMDAGIPTDARGD